MIVWYGHRAANSADIASMVLDIYAITMYIADMATLNLKLDDKLRDRFKIYCVGHRTTMTEVLIDAIHMALDDPPIAPAEPEPVNPFEEDEELLNSPEPVKEQQPFDNSRLQKDYQARKARKGK